MKIVTVIILALLPFVCSAQTFEFFGKKTVTLSWDPVTTYTNAKPIPSTTQVMYKAYYGEASKTYTPRLVRASTSTSISFSGYGQKYFTVQAIADNATSDFAPEVTAILNPPLIPNIPVNITVK